MRERIKRKIEKVVTLSAGARLNVRLARAKELYEIWSHRTGLDSLPWEHLPESHMQAWREIADATIDATDPECMVCGEYMRLICPACDTEEREPKAKA